ncbi:MAG TPA: RDD family protein [Gammaproteobacteria bacterium]|nr:RDD family protein [Gammaproteobacteria bacterium]
MPSPSRPSALLLRRLGAALYDALICAGLVLGTAMVLTLLMGGTTSDLHGPGPAGRDLIRFGVLAVPVAYFLVSWTRGGQTVGMRPWRLRLVALEGGPVPLKAAAVRLAASLLSWAPAGLGFWWSLADRERLAWHDRLSGTRLVRLPKAAPNSPGSAHPEQQ